MKLEEVEAQISEVDEDLIIFQKDVLNVNSDTALFDGEGMENLVLTRDGIKYLYLLEVSIAKEFLDDWIQALKIKPNNKDLTKRLFEYAINDA